MIECFGRVNGRLAVSVLLNSRMLSAVWCISRVLISISNSVHLFFISQRALIKYGEVKLQKYPQKAQSTQHSGIELAKIC